MLLSVVCRLIVSVVWYSKASVDCVALFNRVWNPPRSNSAGDPVVISSDEEEEDSMAAHHSSRAPLHYPPASLHHHTHHDRYVCHCSR